MENSLSTMSLDTLVNKLIDLSVSFGSKLLVALLVFFIGRWIVKKLNRLVINILTYNPQNEKTIFPKRKRKVRSRKDQNESVQFPDTRTKIKQRLSALQMVFKRCFFL